MLDFGCLLVEHRHKITLERISLRSRGVVRGTGHRELASQALEGSLRRSPSDLAASLRFRDARPVGVEDRYRNRHAKKEAVVVVLAPIARAYRDVRILLADFQAECLLGDLILGPPHREGGVRLDESLDRTADLTDRRGRNRRQQLHRSVRRKPHQTEKFDPGPGLCEHRLGDIRPGLDQLGPQEPSLDPREFSRRLQLVGNGGDPLDLTDHLTQQ